MSQVSWSTAALADLNRNYQFLKAKKSDAANRALQAIIQAAKSLGQFPQKGMVIESKFGLRKLPIEFGKYGFVIHYTILDDEVLILKLYHGRQERSY